MFSADVEKLSELLRLHMERPRNTGHESAVDALRDRLEHLETQSDWMGGLLLVIVKELQSI